MRTDPTAAASKWARKMQAASQDYTDGVMAVQQAPGALAVKNQAALVSNFNESVSSGKWARNTQAVDLPSWQQRTTTVGAPRLASGAVAAQPKVQAFMTQFLPFEQNVVNQVKASMPRGSTEQNIQRAVAVMNGLSKFKKGA